MKSVKKYLYPIEYQHLTLREWDEQTDCHVVDWRRARQILQHEDWLIVERVKILFTAQAALSAAFYFLHRFKQSNTLKKIYLDFTLIDVVILIVTFFGVFLAWYISRGMKAARAHQDKVIEWWYSRFNYVPRSDMCLPPRMGLQPPIAGNDPSVGSKRFMIGYSVIALGFAILWGCACVFSFTFNDSTSNLDRVILEKQQKESVADKVKKQN